MPQIGTDAKPTAGYHAYGGNSFPNQEAEPLVLPGQRIRILRLGVWAGGWNGSCAARLCIWNATTGALLAQSDPITFANEGAAGAGVSRYEADLVPAYETPDAGATVYVGFTRLRTDAHQVFTGSTAYTHRHGRAAYPDGAFGEIESYGSQVRRIGAWVQDYEALANIYVLRSGVWTRITPKVYRSSAWVDADAVQVRRGAAWVDAD